MADNVELDPGTGGAVVSTEEITTLNGSAGQPAQHVQRFLLAFRTADGTAVDAPRGGGVEADSVRVTIANDSTGLVSVDDNGGSLTVDNATISVVGGGTEATAQRVTIASDSTGVLSVDDNGSTLSVDDGGSSLTVDNGGTFAVQDSEKLADDAAFTVGTTKVQPAGFFADQASTDSVNEGDIGAARMTLDRKQIVTNAPSADTEGLDTFRSSDIDETEEDVKTAAGKLYGWAVYNDHTSEVFIQFWNATAANTTPGTTTPRVTFPLAAGASANFWVGDGITFDTAITVGATSTFAGGADPTGPVSGTIFYK